MNSEKVKEIKKVLEERTQHTPINCSHSEYVEACGIYCRCHRKFVADMGSKNGEVCKDCNKFTATDESKEYADILTLINELESENERLNKSDTSKEESSIEYYNLYKDLKRKNKDLNELCELQRVSITESFVRENQLKDRIAELEKEKKELAKQVVKITGCSVSNEEVDYECNKKLKQFAEMLKEKVKNFCGTEYENAYYDVTKSGACEDIDETLKEFI
jgi:hypothetical protein